MEKKYKDLIDELSRNIDMQITKIATAMDANETDEKNIRGFIIEHMYDGGTKKGIQNIYYKLLEEMLCYTKELVQYKRELSYILAMDDEHYNLVRKDANASEKLREYEEDNKINFANDYGEVFE